MNKNNTKKIIILMAIFVILFTYSCQSKIVNGTTEGFVYITYETYTEWQVWQIAINGNENNLVYTLPKSISINDSIDKKYFNEKIVNTLVEEYSEEIKSKSFDTSVSIEISPNKMYMAITEGYRYCPNNRCAGQYSVRVIDINSGEQIFENFSITPISIPKWSNDEKYLLFEKLNKENLDMIYSIHVWDIEGGHEILNKYGKSAEFISNSVEIVSEYYDEIVDSSTKDLYCCKVFDPIRDSEKTINIGESYNYDPYNNFSLSPDGESIALEIYNDNFTEIKILDFLTLKQLYTIIPNNSDLYLWRLDWSSDGEYIAFDNGVGEEYLLEVVNIESNRTKLIENNVIQWKWSNNDQRMLIIKINDPDNCVQKDIEIAVFDFQDNKKHIIESPQEIKKFISDLNNGGTICISYINSATW